MNHLPALAAFSSPRSRSAKCSTLLVGLFVFLVGVHTTPSLRAADYGVIAGTISNAETGNLLKGARVTIPQIGRTAFADETGRYVLGGLPARTHELVVSYIGLDAMRAVVNVADGAAPSATSISPLVFTRWTPSR